MQSVIPQVEEMHKHVEYYEMQRPEVSEDGTVTYHRTSFEPPPSPQFGFKRKSHDLQSNDAWVFEKATECEFFSWHLAEPSASSCMCLRIVTRCSKRIGACHQCQYNKKLLA